MSIIDDLKNFRRTTLSNASEIIRRDFHASYKNPIVILLLVAVIVLPSLYGLINIYACWDPYENTGHVQFAIANEDKGATYQDMNINAGNDLVKSLKNNSNFEWVFISSDELRQGVHDGKYYAGIIVPANFSESIISITTDDPHQADLIYIVNEKANPVAAKLTDAAAKAVYNNLNAEIVSFIDMAAYDKLGELRDGLASGAGELHSGGVLLSNGAGQVASGADQLEEGATELDEGAGKLNEGANQLANGTHEARAKVDNVNETIHNGTKYIRNKVPSQEVNRYMDIIDNKSDNVTGSVNALDDGATALADGSGRIKGNISLLSEGTMSLASGAELLANSAASALFMASSSLAEAANGLADVTGVNDTQVGDYIFAPVKLDKHEEFPVSNFGSQVSPFYLVLSMWVGALITCVLLKTGSSVGTKYKPHEVYLGKLSLFNALAILQSIVTVIGCYVLGLDIANPLMFVITCCFVSLIFMAVVYSLVSVFGDVGKGVVIILLLFQISGTGGIYPIQIMNEFFGYLYPFLPMTHGIRIVREAQLGLIWANYIPSFVYLLAMGVIVVIVAIILKQRFDKHTKYFEDKLEESDLFN